MIVDPLAFHLIAAFARELAVTVTLVVDKLARIGVAIAIAERGRAATLAQGPLAVIGFTVFGHKLAAAVHGVVEERARVGAAAGEYVDALARHMVLLPVADITIAIGPRENADAVLLVVDKLALVAILARREHTNPAALIAVPISDVLITFHICDFGTTTTHIRKRA